MLLIVALAEGELVGELVGEFVGAIDEGLEGEGLLDGLGDGSELGVGVAAFDVRRGSDFKAS